MEEELLTQDIVNAKENNFKQTEQSGDDGSNTRGYLIPREQLKEHFIVKKL